MRPLPRQTLPRPQVRLMMKHCSSVLLRLFGSFFFITESPRAHALKEFPYSQRLSRPESQSERPNFRFRRRTKAFNVAIAAVIEDAPHIELHQRPGEASAGARRLGSPVL